jgi:uncharacterized small protein (DUF1192 family)
MTKEWTNREIQKNPQAYLRWQEEERTKAERERKEAQEESDFELFKRLFVEL